MFESNVEEPVAAPVFVSQSGRRGRLLRGLGWPVSALGAVLAVGMGSSLVGMQADAPAMGIPARPSQSASPGPSPTTSPTASPSGSRSPSPSGTRSPSPSPSRSSTVKPKSSAGTTKPSTRVTPSGQSTAHA